MIEIIYSLVSYSIGKEFPPENPNSDPKKLGITGMIVIILSLSVLFITSLIGYFWVKQAAITKGTWVPLGVPKIPNSLFLSTLLLLFSSISFHRALGFYQEKNILKYKVYFYITFSLAFLFLLSQILSWKEMVDWNLKPSTANLYSFTFYFLTSLHAFHVLFGIISLVRILIKTLPKVVKNDFGNLLILSAMYWHFLDFVWIILFIVLYFF